MFMLGRGSGTHTATPAAPRRTHTHAVTTTPTTPARHAKDAKHATKTKPAPTHAKHTARKPAGYRGNKVYATLPQPLQWQLAHHKVVIVSLYNPSSDVD